MQPTQAGRARRLTAMPFRLFALVAQREERGNPLKLALRAILEDPLVPRA